MERIDGAYPGGPRKRDDEDGGESRRPNLAPAEEREGRLHDRHRRIVRRRRKKRILVGFLVALLVAGGLGFWMGFQANRTSEEIAAEQESGRERGFDLTRERNTILQQLWLMEDLELERSRRP